MIAKGIIGAALVLIPTLAACQRSPADDQAAVEEAQRRADEVAAKARSDAEEKAAEAQAKVNDAARRADAAFARARDDLRASTQHDLDALLKQIDGLEVRMNKLTGHRRAELVAALKEIEEKRASLQAAIASIDAVSAESFAALEAMLKARLEELQKAIDQVDSST